MFKFSGQGSITNCDGISRRDFLQAGALGAIGLTMPGFAKLKAEGKVDSKKSNKACIMIFNLGAPSQQDLWDMKPDAPAQIRGEFHAQPRACRYRDHAVPDLGQRGDEVAIPGPVEGPHALLHQRVRRIQRNMR